eukprot:143310_1
MSLSQQNVDLLKRIPRRTKDTVSGWIRENQKSIVPPLIIHICIVFYFKEFKKIELIYHSHRAHSSGSRDHPKNILVENNPQIKSYRSDEVQNFKKNEKDWIIFKLKQNISFLPTQFILKTCNYLNAIKQMTISIGNNEINKWILCKPNLVNIKCSNHYQSFDIYGINWKMMNENDNKPNYIKIEFINNHDIDNELSKQYVKYQCTEFKLYGIVDYKWLCHLDEDSQNVFYERISDGFVTWERPSKQESVKPHWLAHMDANSGELYFENIHDGETTWDKPDEFNDPDDTWHAKKDMESPSGDYYYENLKTNKTQWEIPKCFMGGKVWMRHFDATSGEYYYENLKTAVTSWNCPPSVQFD